MKTYRVPVIHHVSFGCEVEVRAKSIEQAKRLAVQSDAAVCDGYNWNRQSFERAEIGDWAKIQVVGEES